MKLKIKKFKDLLIELMACDEAITWAGDMTIEEVVEKCDRGDWLLWLAKNIGISSQPLTLAKGYCAKTVYHLMKDERSKKAAAIAIAFGEGKATEEELKTAAYDAYDAVYDTAADADASFAAAYAAYYAAYDSYAYDADDDAANAAAYTKTKNQLETADICRKYIGQLIIDKVKLILSGEL